MISRNNVQAVIIIAVIFWGLALFFQGVDLYPALLRPYSLVVGGVIIILALYDNLLWRIPYLRWIPGRPPNLNGTWAGVLTSNYCVPGSSTPVAPVLAFIVVTQSASEISIKQVTTESHSRTLTCALDRSSESWTASYTYINEPNLSVQIRSSIHRGAGILNIHGSPPSSIEGPYWTSRGTMGTVDFTHWSSQKHSRFEDARNDPAFKDFIAAHDF